MTDKDLIAGIKKCIANAQSLIRDALILKSNSSIERSYTLFQLANEEIGKSLLVYFFATLPDKEKPKHLKQFLKEFTDHKIKTNKAISLDAILLASIKRKVSRRRFYIAIQEEYSQINNLNNLKNFSLYTSLIDSKFRAPKELITKKLLKSIEARATLRLDLVKSFFDVSLRNFWKHKENYAVIKEKYDIDALAQEFMNDLQN